MRKNQIILISTVIILVVALILFYIFYYSSRSKSTPEEETLPSSEELLKQGETGEISGDVGTEKALLPLPQAIFNTSGIISEIKKDSLIVQGDGSNFEDRKERELILIFTDSTITFEPGQKIKYQGLAGLKYLKTGGAISISSPENIRGKTQFTVDYINKL
jgi:hypothetical protein